MILLILPIILVAIVQANLMSNYKKYAAIENSREITGLQAARIILDKNNLSDVQIFEGNGQLSDYFDPTRNIIKLSPEVYRETSIASLAIAAHEVGHAIQYATNYPVIGLRNRLLPLTITASNFAWIVIFLGIVLSSSNNFYILYLGIMLLGIIALFQIVTLPLEFNASTRALAQLEDGNLLNQEEIVGAKKVLSAAALTYVVAVITSIIEIIRLLLFTNRD